ncbi:MAG TPA: hypothetical protein VFP72_13295 [Kineosporiaceae bacterium]|nr:hypothetical protein [Kineosporiaceae bacterium]
MSEPSPVRPAGSGAGNRPENGPGPDLTDRDPADRDPADQVPTDQDQQSGDVAPTAKPSAGQTRSRQRSVDVDPEDWAASPGSTDDRILRERPPHW